MISMFLPDIPLKTRCFCCGARSWSEESRSWSACKWCGASRRRGGCEVPGELAVEMVRTLRCGAIDLSDREGRYWHLDGHALRIAATGVGLWFTPDEERQPPAGRDMAPVGQLTCIAETEPLPISLVALVREPDPTVSAFLEKNSALFEEIVLVVDDASGEGCEWTDRPGVTIVRRALDGDFAAQRNAGNDAASHPWVFHLDCDETVSPLFAATMPTLAARADAAGLRAVGFSRRNIVHHQMSDLFPDVQYRLLRRDVRFEGRVHERPDACADWRQTTVSLHGVIDHAIPIERIAQRRAIYDAMGQDAARHEDDAALLRAFAG